MIRRALMMMGLVAGSLAAGGAATGLTHAPNQPEPKAATDVALMKRLAELRPDDPRGYLLAAEEVGDNVEDADRLKLARELYVLAFELDRRTGRPGATAASAALGLASVERLDRDRRWLAALAGAIDRRYALPDWTVAATNSISEELAYNAATVLGLSRSGEGKQARTWLDKPGVVDTLKRYERLIGTSGETGALSRLDKYMQAWPCPECGNERAVMKPGEKGRELRLCATCGGNPGPQLSEEELIAQLRFEAALLNGIQRSWASQVIVDQSAPLRDPDPEELAATYKVDAGKPYWRGGKWTDKP